MSNAAFVIKEKGQPVGLFNTARFATRKEAMVELTRLVAIGHEGLIVAKVSL